MGRLDSVPHMVDNWAGTHGSYAFKVCYPKTEEEVRDIVLQSLRLDRKLKAMGARHSPNDIFCVQDKQGSSIDMREMSELWDISKEHMTVTVGAGMLLSL